MSNQDEVGYRHIYARQILAKAGVTQNQRLESALTTVRREDFLGPPPWLFRDVSQYRELASSDPLALYQDMLVTLDAARHVNNGMPSLHANALHRLGIREGETVVHLGAGSGYYTAIIAELVGASGKVIGVEYDAALAERAQTSLSGYPQVSIVHGDGLKWASGDLEADVIYANFALDHPPAAWIDNLASGGRLLFPFGVPTIEAGRPTAFSRWAAFLMIDRRPRAFGAQFLAPVSFIWAEGQEPAPEGRHEALAEAFKRRNLARVRSFRWCVPAAGEEWYGEDDWGLSFDEV
ncbi:methyltransferase domain-containing protein [Rhizobiales bacterium RZME27]|uniref:Protein-L-isoaspartate O-methyltransferase n=1 Tax=Endobacterium cereale TaxID=2663029 RepID=A0A6A8AA00_9HYPH|nr:rRNA adenine N-6-methyltransferase family protein [Endobacterium cereale]MEB2846204.1 rRNA adenine N-6-methyltransferase family protein [Endobacterium cereale]MQY45641.1 methyltransferase domain-containing protein [Endobacterium cereale]